jgi:cytoskeletal protein RodZ
MTSTEQIDGDQKDIGTFLIALREEKGIELRQISQKTRINLTLLKALEETAIDRLPDLTYVKGFVKSYAKEIGADIGECLGVLESTYDRHNYTKKELEGLQADQLIEDSKLAVTGTSAKKIASHISIKEIAIGAAIVVVGFCLILVFRESTPPAQVTQKSKPISPTVENVVIPEKILSEPIESDEPNNSSEEQTAQTRTDTKVENSEVKTENKAEPIISKTEPEATSKEQVVKKEVSVQEPEDEADEAPVERDPDIDPSKITLDFTIRDFTLPLFEVISNSPETNDENFLPLRAKQSVVSGLQNVFINAVYDDTWITYKSGSKPIKSFVLKKGRTVIIRDQVIQLFMGNVRAAKLFLNNQLLKVSSPTGVKSLVFPHSASSKFKLPLFVFDRKTGMTFTLKDYLTKIGKPELLQSAQSN